MLYTTFWCCYKLQKLDQLSPPFNFLACIKNISDILSIYSQIYCILRKVVPMWDQSFWVLISDILYMFYLYCLAHDQLFQALFLWIICTQLFISHHRLKEVQQEQKEANQEQIGAKTIKHRNTQSSTRPCISLC